jgi:hypothetical protein
MYRPKSLLLHRLLLPLGEAKKQKTPMTILRMMEYPSLRKNSKGFILKTGYGQLWGVLVLFKMFECFSNQVIGMSTFPASSPLNTGSSLPMQFQEVMAMADL